MTRCPKCGTPMNAGAVDPPGPHGRPELKCPQCGGQYQWVAEQLQLAPSKPPARLAKP